jgi:catechol 2,3-dioxygenase-like lactoylglutathione lyase family enzyme
MGPGAIPAFSLPGGLSEERVTLKLGRVVLYARDVEACLAFYAKHFGFRAQRAEGDRITELANPDGGANIMVHQAAKSLKKGQVLVKLVFDVENVAGFVKQAAERNLTFGPIQDGGGYFYANAKDPDGNSISVSSRAFSRRHHPPHETYAAPGETPAPK